MSIAVSSDSHVEAEGSSELCSICCDPIRVVSVGRCNHALTCAICSLRLRLCYRDNACPFCKRRLKEVFLTEKTPSRSPLNFVELAKRRRQFVTDDAWPRGIWVDSKGKCEGRPLMQYLTAKMKMSCVLCDPSGLDEEFESFKQLREHFKKSHGGSTICNVCYQASRYFPRELEVFKDDDAFKKHAESHPQCDFCGHRFFGKDELFNHMKRKHCLCHLCHARGERHLYFENTQHYIRHLQEAHFVCNEPGCVNCLIAFNTVQEFNNHLADVHGILTAVGVRGARTVNTVITRFNAMTSHPAAQRRAFEGNDLQQRGAEGMVMIDDDLPPVYAFPATNQGHRRPVANRSAPRREEFPALPVANPATVLPVQPKKLLVRTECPCGRRSQSVLAMEGMTPDALSCDAECERAKRRARLAEAFNIDTATYSGAFSSTFSVDLITWARLYTQKAQQIEQQLYERIRLRDVQRFKLEGVTRDMKKLVIELVDSCGAVGRSVRNANEVEVILTDRCALPAKKLSQYAASLTEEEYRNLVRESLKNVMFLEDIQKSINPRRYLMTWDGDYEMEYVSNSAMKLKFRTPQAFKSASDGLAGGIRGAFKVRYPLKDTDNDAQSEALRTKLPEEDGPTRTAERQRDRKNSWKKERPPPEELTLGNSFEALSRL